MNSTMTTIDAMHASRVRSVRPQVGRVLLAGAWVEGKGSSVSAATLADVRVSGDAYVPAFGFGGAIATQPVDVESQPFGEPPV